MFRCVNKGRLFLLRRVKGVSNDKFGCTNGPKTPVITIFICRISNVSDLLRDQSFPRVLRRRATNPIERKSRRRPTRLKMSHVKSASTKLSVSRTACPV